MDFIFIIGPPAVGKMTVGQALSQKTEFPLFHNHLSIEAALSMFGHGSPEFKRINEGIRTLVFETAAQSDTIKGLIFTLVMAFDDEEDWTYIERIKEIFQAASWTFYFVELTAPLPLRLERNKMPSRLAAKASKRNIEKSEKGLLDCEKKYQLNSTDRKLGKHHLIIDNTNLSAEQVAAMIIEQFNF